jgi:uroporphyrinogen III methyltransferase/synthase
MSPSLDGLRVLLTRPEGDGMDAWAEALRAADAVPICYPVIAAQPPESWKPLDAALAALGSYDWVVFTSQTAVSFVLGRFPGRQFPADLRPQIASVGAKTAQAVAAGGGSVALVPVDNRQEGLVQALSEVPPGTRILLPMAAGGRTLLPTALRARGCVADVVTAYATVPRLDLPPPPPFDVATFASPSALRAFARGPGTATLQGKTVAVIGRTTAEEAASRGLNPVVAESPSVEHLIRAIADARPAKGDP